MIKLSALTAAIQNCIIIDICKHEKLVADCIDSSTVVFDLKLIEQNKELDLIK